MVFFRILHAALSVNFVGAFGAFCFCGSAGHYEIIGFCGRSRGSGHKSARPGAGIASASLWYVPLGFGLANLSYSALPGNQTWDKTADSVE